MDRLQKEFATDIEFKIALDILDILKEHPQVFMVKDALERLYEKHGIDKAKRLLCDHVFFDMVDFEYIALVNGAVKLDHKGASYIANRNLTGSKKIITGLFNLIKKIW